MQGMLVTRWLSGHRQAWVLTLVLVFLAAAAGAARPVAELREFAQHADGNERRKAATALGEHPTAEAVTLLLEIYRAETTDAFGVRAACAEALGNTGYPAAAAALKELLGDLDYWVRKHAADALGRLPGVEATAVLAGAAKDRDPRVRAAAVLALGGRADSENLLLQAYEDRDANVAAAALEALVVGRHPQAAALLEPSLGASSWQVRYRAAALLARTGDPRGLELLEEAVRDGRHLGAALREAAAAGGPAVAALAKWYRNGDEPLAARVLDTLEGMECGEATNFFIALALAPAAAPADRVRAATILFDRREALGPDQVKALGALLDAADPNLLAVGLQLLLERGGADHLARVVPLVGHANKVVRHFALANLRSHGDAAYESSFIAALADDNGANVRLALEALGELGSPRALAAIHSLEENRMYRRYAQAAAEAIEARAR